MYVEWCLGHIGVGYAKAIYFWRLAAPKICIAEDARPQILSLHHLLLTLLRGTIILLRRYPSDSYSYPCPFVRHKSPFSSSTINPEISRFFNKDDYCLVTIHQDAAPYFFTFHTSHSLWEVRKHGTVARYYKLRSSECRFALKVRSSVLCSNWGCWIRTAFRYDTSMQQFRVSRIHRCYVIHPERS